MSLISRMAFAVRSVKRQYERSAQYEQLLRKMEQIYALLAISTALCPGAVKQLDEAVAVRCRPCTVPVPLSFFHNHCHEGSFASLPLSSRKMACFKGSCPAVQWL
jgi:hypothetical protein